MRITQSFLPAGFLHTLTLNLPTIYKILILSDKHRKDPQAPAQETSTRPILNDEKGETHRKNLLDGLKGNFFGGIRRNQTGEIHVFE